MSRVVQCQDALLLDDGELDDVQKILEDLGVGFGRVRGSAIAAKMRLPEVLLVATPRRIQTLDLLDSEGPRPIRVVVLDGDSNTLRERLREVGFDFLVRRPVHPEALRLLIMHCLYRGEERRNDPRVPVGLEISFKAGMFSRRATMVDLSSRGCRLLSEYTLLHGDQIRVQISESLGSSETLIIDGRVLRVEFDESLGTEGLYRSAVEFENLSRDAQRELEWIVEDKVTGPPTINCEDDIASESPNAGSQEKVKPPRSSRQDTREAMSPNLRPDPRSEGFSIETTDQEKRIDDAPATSTQLLKPPHFPVDLKMVPPGGDEAAEADRAGEEAADDRRSNHRRPFGVNVAAFGSRALRVLVGRDLSAGGMRIVANPDLEVGDRLHLAIYGSAGEEPFMVWGTIERDDGEMGMAIGFDKVHPIIAEKLEKLLASLPAVESLHDSEADAMGTVLTEILDT